MGSFSIWHWLVVLIIFSPLIIGMLVMGRQEEVLVKHQQAGLVKKGYFGYCWTYFFLGWLIPIFRGEIGIGALHLVFTVVTFGIFHIVMPYLYNKQYMTRLLTSGWQLSDEEQVMAIARLKLGVAQP